MMVAVCSGEVRGLIEEEKKEEEGEEEFRWRLCLACRKRKGKRKKD